MAKIVSISSLTLWKIYILVSLIFYGTSVFGPYSWKIYSVEGIVYFIIVNFLFFVGLCTGPLFLNRKKDSKKENASVLLFSGITPVRESILIGVSLVALLFSFYEIVVLVNYYGASFEFLGDQYLERDASRTLIDKIAVVVMQFGTASYIIYKLARCNKGIIANFIVLLGLFSCGVYYLFIGNRFTLAVEVIIFLVCNLLTGSFSLRKVKRKIPAWLIILLTLLLIIVVFLAFLAIFSNRPHTEILLKYEFFPGDEELKPFYVSLYNSNPSLWDPLLMLADYMGEAPYIFSGVWEFYIPDHIYWFLNTLRPVGQLLSIFGLPSYTEIVAEIGSPAKYSGIAYSLIVDFGIYLAPVAAYLFGLIFSSIDTRRNISSIARTLYPCCVACVIFAPIYYFNVGRMDFVVFALLILFFLIGPLDKSKQLSN